MALSSGTKLGPYEIQSPLGAGGMGEVYRARDTRLGREVAIKVLPEALARDAGRLRRFEQEALTIAALNHPNILAIHDIGTHDGAPFLVSELLEGETLRTELEAGPLPVRRAIEYSLGIAHGLAAAHEKGIVHRDLKPENIFIRRDGRVKVLDFGLAKLMQPEESKPVEATLTAAATTPGMIIGTVGYMSPEQVRAQATDHRSDIFSFGAVLYEMISGKRAFKGESSIEAMNAIIKDEPAELTGTGLQSSPGLERITRRCLEKLPERRFQSASDLAFALETTTHTSGAVASPSPAKPIPNRWVALTVAATIIAALLALFIHSRFVREPPAAVKFTRFSFRPGTIFSARFSPDGEMIVYSAALDGQPPDLYSVRREYPESQPVGIKGARLLAISRKGQMAVLVSATSLAHVTAEGTLATTPIGGTTPREVAEHITSADWSPDGNNLAVIRHVGGKFRLEFPLGRTLYETIDWIDQVRVSPDGTHLAFFQHPPGIDDRGDVLITDLSGSLRTVSSGWEAAEGLAWVPSGKEVWFSAVHAGTDLAIHSATLDGTERLVNAQPGGVRIQDISATGEALLSRDDLTTKVELASRGFPPRDISWLNFSWGPVLSRDGSLVSLIDQSEFGGNTYSVYIRKTAGSSAVRLGAGTTADISPDRKWTLAYDLSGGAVLLPIGAGETRTLRWNGIEVTGAAFFPDSQRILLMATQARSNTRFYLTDTNASPPRPLGEDSEPSKFISVSPDGQFVAHPKNGQWFMQSINTGAVTPMPGIGPAEYIVRWSGEGKSVYVVHEGDNELTVYRVAVDSGRSELLQTLRPTAQVGLISMRNGYFGFDVDASGTTMVFSYETNVDTLYTAQGIK
jgi:serine/threonine protein kinase/Tol biopolymer transport system component